MNISSHILSACDLCGLMPKWEMCRKNACHICMNIPYSAGLCSEINLSLEFYKGSNVLYKPSKHFHAFVTNKHANILVA